MYRLWETVVGPILDALDPRVVVEVGVSTGEQTRQLVEYAERSGAHVHAIDPAPGELAPDVAESRSLSLHRSTSLTTLTAVGPVDAALLDGDHNWYTVINELRLLRGTAHSAGREMPLVLCHDVGWPYGRRDLYYDPGRIPDDFRHEWRQAGVVPGQSELSDSGGLNAHLCNATFEGGPRNGVMTAIEDFVDEVEEPISVVRSPVLHGIAILTADATTDANARLAEELEGWRSPPAPWEQLAELAEAERVKSLLAAKAAAARQNGGRGSVVDRPRGAPATEAQYAVDLPADALLSIQEGIKRGTYRGLKFLKSPFDVLLYIDLIGRTEPRTVIEIGTKEGGGALWFADTLAAHGIGSRVISVDLEPPELEDERVTLIRGDANRLEEVLSHELLSSLPHPLIVSEDSSHDPETTLKVLEFFDAHLQPGDYIVVEDGVLSQLTPDHYRRWGAGPNAAVAAFLDKRAEGYEVDRDLCDRFGRNVTWSPNAWLRRK